MYHLLHVMCYWYVVYISTSKIRSSITLHNTSIPHQVVVQQMPDRALLLCECICRKSTERITANWGHCVLSSSSYQDLNHGNFDNRILLPIRLGKKRFYHLPLPSMLKHTRNTIHEIPLFFSTLTSLAPLTLLAWPRPL